MKTKKKRKLSNSKRLAAAVLDILPPDSAEDALTVLTEAYTYVAIGYLSAQGLQTTEREGLLNEWLHIHNEYVRTNTLSFSTHQLARLKESLGT